MDLFLQAERQRKEEADAMRKAEDEAKKKSALSNMGSGYSSHLQKVQRLRARCGAHLAAAKPHTRSSFHN